jgi:ABC-type phosphate transport system substrate-binding protein
MNNRWINVLLAVGLGALCVAVSPRAALAVEYAVVANPDVEVGELKFSELRKILLGDRQFWSTGQKITLIIRAPVSDERTVLLEQVYDMTEAQYRQYWISKVFRAEATHEPKIVLSSGEILELIGAIPGGISIVDAKEVPAGLNVIRIDGKLPGDAGYLLVDEE